MTISIENWEKITEMIAKLKQKPFQIDVYEGNNYVKIEFYFREIKQEMKT